MGNQVSLIIGQRMFTWDVTGRCLSRTNDQTSPFYPCRPFDMPGGVSFAMAGQAYLYLFNAAGECFRGVAEPDHGMERTDDNPTRHQPLARFNAADCNVERADALHASLRAEERARAMQADIDAIAQIEAQAEAAANQVKAQAEALKERKATLKASQAEFKTHATAAGEFAPAEPGAKT
jgi:hypothetical protein